VGRGAWPRNIQLDFGVDLDHGPDPGIFKGFFIYYCDSYSQPRIKHDILGGGLNGVTAL